MTDGAVVFEGRKLSCTKADLPLMRLKAGDIRTRIRSLEDEKKKIEKGQSYQEALNSSILVLSIVKATAEAFVDLGSELTGKTSKKLELIKKLRGYADPAGKIMAGKIDGKGIFDAGLDSFEMPEDATDVEKCLHKFSKNTTKLMAEGITDNLDGVQTSAAKAIQGAHCAAAYSAMRGTEAQTGARKLWGNVAGKVGKLIEIGSVIEKYNKELETAFDEYLAEDFSISTGGGGKGAVMNLIEMQKINLAKLEATISDCEASLPPRKLDSGPTFNLNLA